MFGYWWHPLYGLSQEEIEELHRQGVLKPSLLQVIGDFIDNTIDFGLKILPFILIILIVLAAMKLNTARKVFA